MERSLQNKNLKEQLNKEDTVNPPKKESRIMIVKMTQDLRKRMEAQIKKIQEMFNKDLGELMNTQIEMNTRTEMKNTLEGITSRIAEAEEGISDLGDRMVEISVVKQKKEKRMKRNEDRDFLAAQWLRHHTSTAGGKDSISAWETKILHAAGCGPKSQYEIYK